MAIADEGMLHYMQVIDSTRCDSCTSKKMVDEIGSDGKIFQVINCLQLNCDNWNWESFYLEEPLP